MAQVRPCGPLLSAPTVAGVSNDCKKENTKHRKSKRIITPARKEQNRVAQRLYRQRHKQQKARKDKPIDAGSKPRLIQPRDTKGSEASSAPNISDFTQPASVCDAPDLKIQHDHTNITLPAFDAGLTATRANYPPACTLEQFIVDDIPSIQADSHLNHLDQTNILLDVGEFLDSSSVPDLDGMACLDTTGFSVSHLATPAHSVMDHLHLSSLGDGLDPDLVSTFHAKLRMNRIMTEDNGWLETAMSSFSTSEAQDVEHKEFISSPPTRATTLTNPSNHGNNAFLADPYQNAISFSQVTILNICAQNARCLGMAPEEFINDNCLSLCSPFYRPASASDDPTTLLAAVCKPYTPKFLQPTLSQILFPHHPIFDLIPIPAFRERAIMLATTSPALLNSLELKRDILYGGLVCWGTRHGSSHSGKGQPWDLRSWEAAPWFLKKWRLLVDGKDGDLWKQSMWWRNLRGEPMVSE